jgi:hypothetical protein
LTQNIYPASEISTLRKISISIDKRVKLLPVQYRQHGQSHVIQYYEGPWPLGLTVLLLRSFASVHGSIGANFIKW